jgi:hypothetical protein
LNPFALCVVPHLLEGSKTEFEASRLEESITQHPEWAEYIMDSILLRQHGAEAAKLYGMPVDSSSWKAAQKKMAFLWERIDYQNARAGVRNAAQEAAAHTLKAIFGKG